MSCTPVRFLVLVEIDQVNTTVAFKFLSLSRLLFSPRARAQTSTIRGILQIICKAHLVKSHSAGTFEQNNVKFADL
jgi:hypothetical protein